MNLLGKKKLAQLRRLALGCSLKMDLTLISRILVHEDLRGDGKGDLRRKTSGARGFLTPTDVLLAMGLTALVGELTKEAMVGVVEATSLGAVLMTGEKTSSVR